MTVRLIRAFPKKCSDASHDGPPTWERAKLEPGVYENTCPTCGNVTRFTVGEDVDEASRSLIAMVERMRRKQAVYCLPHGAPIIHIQEHEVNTGHPFAPTPTVWCGRNPWTHDGR